MELSIFVNCLLFLEIVSYLNFISKVFVMNFTICKVLIPNITLVLLKKRVKIDSIASLSKSIRIEIHKEVS